MTTYQRNQDVAARAEHRELVAGTEVHPERVPFEDIATGTEPARNSVVRDGAVILRGLPPTPDALVLAIAAMTGTDLRELEAVRTRITVDAPQLELHRDGAHVVAIVDDRETQLRLPNPDYVGVLCGDPAASGGENFVIDGYLLVERLRHDDPELHEFLTTELVDVTSRITRDDVHRPPRVNRLVQWTRAGRMSVREGMYAQPVARVADAERHRRLIHRWEEVLATATEVAAPGTALDRGDVLFLDNYRCLHGARAHPGERTTYVVGVRTKNG